MYPPRGNNPPTVGRRLIDAESKKNPVGRKFLMYPPRGNNPPTVGRRYTDVERTPLGRKFLMYPPRGNNQPTMGATLFGNGVWEPVGPFCLY